MQLLLGVVKVKKIKDYKGNAGQKNTKLQCVLNQFRERAERAGLTEEDVQREVEKVRSELITILRL